MSTSGGGTAMEADARKKKKTVTLLYVENEPTTRHMVTTMLKQRYPRLTLHLAENGRKGLDQFNEHHPDIVLTDILMPVMDGIQMAREIKALDRSARIIMLTAASNTDYFIDSIDIGINHYVLKPIMMGKLFAAIDHCLDSIGLERQLRQQDEEIRLMAYHDSLTGLPNRLLFNELLYLALALAQRHDHERNLAVLFLDLDRFKVINDTLGHTVGDQLLQAVAERLKECCRRDRDTVARRGGDEFIILLPDIDTTREAVNVAQKIINAFSYPFAVSEHELFVGASIGISIYPDDGADCETLIRNSDMAMYRAKEQGRNRYCLFNQSMNDQAAQRLGMENSLRRALQRGEFFLDYQPEINVRNGSVIGFEALVRWRHPELGLVPPKKFICLAEETGLIVPLGEWILRNACAQNKEWQDAGLPHVRIAVNLSPREFQNANLADVVEHVLTETGLQPRWLELEVTEGIMIHDMETTSRTLRRLSNLGVHISIDDFGTGYSSLSYIKKLPINTLKIDQSFVNDVTTNADDAAIATAIITMAQSLRLNVVAEGVEAREQMKFLYSRKCQGMQGFYFSKPVPADEIQPLLRETHWKDMIPQRATIH
ncbi:MAG TPA: EAL domain-containing protein [Geobacteraceae bacterium]